MKKKTFILLSLLFTLTACGTSGNSTTPSQTIDIDSGINTTQKTGELSEFSLISPADGIITDGVNDFTWGASNNAETYTLEICSSNQFISDLETVDYYKRENIVGTSFKTNSSFAYRDRNYYWRVTAKNSKGELECSSVFSFYVKAPEVEEFEFDLGEPDNWNLHPLGSYADIDIDSSNFFGNNKDALKISFKKEDTSRGVPESDGWIIVTKSVEKSIYGTDALYFNCFYAGHDTRVVIRLVDRDNEYWYCRVLLSFNAQQSIILKFSDFVQRYGDVTVANETFDFERIKYLEVVFEETFGDGVFLISDIKAIKFSNYANMFITKLNFSEYDKTSFIFENYNFEYKINDDYELELPFYNSTEDGHEKINGYGFTKLVVNKYMMSGDAIRVSVKYQGAKGTNVLLRIYEEDTDRWSYKIPYSSLVEDEYTTLLIPYVAFAKSSILGDGRRQFYYVYNLQFGLEGTYSTGKVFFKDFEIVKMADYVDPKDTVRVVADDGLIEDFNNYKFNADLFKIWVPSSENKDEYMQLDSTFKLGSDNPYCGRFDYKADMLPAQYYLPIESKEGFTSLSLWLKDGTKKPNDPSVSHIESVNPDVSIYIRLKSGELYLYELKALDKAWNEYDIPFNAFKSSTTGKLSTEDIMSESITHVGISIQYYYYDKNGKPMPLYIDDMPVYVDDIRLSNYEQYHKVLKERIITMVDGVATIDDFETYQNNEELEFFWGDGAAYDYQHKELSTNVSSRGGTQSMALQYKLNNSSPVYSLAPTFDTNVASKAFRIDMASEKPLNVYVNFYCLIGSSTVQFRASINSINSAWTEYVVGFDLFSNISGGSTKMTSSNIQNITKITIGIDLWNQPEASLVNLYIDNFAFDSSYSSYGVNTKTVIE